MASWIVHLRVAEKLLQAWPGLDPAQFAVGNIAPDAGIPDEKWETFTPPPEVTHFKGQGEGGLYGDTVFYRRYLVPLARDAGASPLARDAGASAAWPGAHDQDPLRRAFLLGYYCHLATDNRWYVEIGEPTQQRWQAQFAQDKNFIWEVKDDWYGLDFRYVRSHPDCLFWRVFLTCSYRADYLDFLPVEAVRQRVEYIREFYQRDDDSVRAMMNRPFIYLSEREMDSFVERTIQGLLNRQFSQI
jgi:hypothetical protein